MIPEDRETATEKASLRTAGAFEPPRLMGGTTLVAAGLAAAALLGARPARAVSPPLTFAQIPGTGDTKVLNYALALEALETDLYVQARQRLTTGGVNALGRTIPGLNLGAGEPDVLYVTRFGVVEAEHRDFLNTALAGSSLLRSAPFNNARFDFGMESLSRRQVLDLVYTAEATGVRAYLGAITSFATKNFLAIAGAIQGTEARHTAIIAIVLNQLFGAGLNTAPLASENNGIDQPLAPDAVLAAVSPFIVL